MVRLNTGKVPVTTMPSPYRDKVPDHIGYKLIYSVCILYTVCLMQLLYLIIYSQQGHAVSPKHPDTHWSTEPAWHRCLPEPWGVPVRRGTPGKTKEKRDRPRLQCKQQHQATGGMGVQTTGSRCSYTVSATWRIRNSELGSAVSEALDKPTWVLILIAQMERISK